MDLMLKKNQPGDKHPHESLIQKFQEWKGDPDPQHIHMELANKDKMFSSSGHGGIFSGHGLWPGEGTRFKNRSIIEPGKWDIYPMNITQVEEVAIMRWFKKQLGRWYDWTGIIGQPFPGNIQLGWMWYCSEITHRAVYKFCHEKPIPEMKKIRPGQVKAIYQKAGLI